MIRRIFIFAAALSLLLCIGTAALWVRSYHTRDVLVDWRPHSGIVATSIRGEMKFHRVALVAPYDFGEAVWDHQSLQADTSYIDADALFMGFGGTVRKLWNSSPELRGQEVIFWCPHWAFLIAFSLLPAILIARRVRQRRPSQSGHCPDCGYDLRASKDRCPECGNRISHDASRTP